MRRNHCLEWIEKNNYPKPPRSACTFCPFHSKIEWLEIKKNKNEWNEVVAMDRAIRNQEKFKKNKDGSDFFEDKLYLHRNCEPIENVNFEEEDNQLDLFNMECEGYCGN